MMPLALFLFLVFKGSLYFNNEMDRRLVAAGPEGYGGTP